MKRLLFLLIIPMVLVSCKKDKNDPDPSKSNADLISLNQWQLDKYSNLNGQIVPISSLNSEALFLFAMNFEFRADGEVRGIDKVSGNIIDKGVWSFLSNNESVNVKLSALDYDFRIVNIQVGKLTLQAPTGNFLSGVGEQINLDFTAVVK
jgi:hypothetical protein